MKRFHWGYFTAINGNITYNESLKKHHYSIKHLRVELELRGTTKNNTDFRHTHTYTSTYLIDSTPCLFWKRKQCVTLHGSFSQQNLGSTKKSLGNTYVFDAGILPGRFPTNIVFSQKKKKQRVFLRFPMSHLME